MAQRFGGKFSRGAQGQDTPPPAVSPFDGKMPARAGFRSNLLFLSALLFLPAAFGGTPRALVLGLAATGLAFLGAWLTRDGLKAHAAYDMRRIARRPAIPRKIFGALLIGAALGAGALMDQTAVLFPALFAIIGAALHMGAFGPDPLRDKGAEGIDAFQSDRVAKVVTEAEAHLTAMRDAILRARDRDLDARVDRFAATARQMFRSVENDPGDLTAARKYLSVYLQGARDATVKFADLYAQRRDSQARADYEALLTDLETNFARRTTALLSNDKTDLDVEIGVLRDRLRLEG